MQMEYVNQIKEDLIEIVQKGTFVHPFIVS
jgi:hypothetical protein